MGNCDCFFFLPFICLPYAKLLPVLLDQPTNLRGEVVVKWYEAIQTNLPMCWLAAVGGTMR